MPCACVLLKKIALKKIEKKGREYKLMRGFINPLTSSTLFSLNFSKSNIQELTTTFPPPPQLIEEDSIITRQTKNENKKFNYKRNEIISTEEVTGKADPFQEENDIVQNEGNLIKEEINLDPELLTGLNENEIIVISQQVEIGETEEQEGGTNNSQCSRKKRTTTTTNILNGEGKFY
ncbi:unnamed protein product [Meloidogyne enterolobii]|uniref:Uncharacterized protein n=1 Tax=Meloidogyne enterolobii TaxID=390850 RepID=A0ACB0YT28_MELEN